MQRIILVFAKDTKLSISLGVKATARLSKSTTDTTRPALRGRAALVNTARLAAELLASHSGNQIRRLHLSLRGGGFNLKAMGPFRRHNVVPAHAGGFGAARAENEGVFFFF